MLKQIGLLVLAAILLATESLSTVGCSSVSNKIGAPTSESRLMYRSRRKSFEVSANLAQLPALAMLT